MTGRHIITNFDEVYGDMILKKNDIYINLSDNLKFCDTTSFGASKKFIINYFLPEAKKTSDLYRTWEAIAQTLIVFDVGAFLKLEVGIN